MSDTVRYSRATPELTAGLEILNAEGGWDEIECGEDALEAIEEERTEVPALVAALALSVEYQNNDVGSKAAGVRDMIVKELDQFCNAVPDTTDALNKLKQALAEAADAEGADGNSVRQAYVEAAEKLLAEHESGDSA